jgi:Flp pilus assembly protein TadG
MTRARRWWSADSGQSVGPELLILLVVALIGWGFLAWLGRLTSASQDIANTAQSAARAASQQSNPTDALRAATDATNASNLAAPCTAQPHVAMEWKPGPTGTWRGGSVTVTLSCAIDNREAFTGAGRLISASDTQVIDRYRTTP